MASARRQIDAVGGLIATLREGPLDAELLANMRGMQFDALGEQLVALSAYIEFARKWYSFLPMRPRSNGAAVLAKYSMRLIVPNAERVRKFIIALAARLELKRFVKTLDGPSRANVEIPLVDDVLEKAFTSHAAVIELMSKVRTDAALGGIGDRVAEALHQPEIAAGFIASLRNSVQRAVSLEKLEETIEPPHSA